MTRILVILAVILVLPLAAQGEQAGGAEENTAKAIVFLIEEVEGSHLTFIRNGEIHSSEEAATHIRRKYKHFKSQIETPEDFIRLCASKSLVSGKPYLVVTPQGTVTVESWLGQILVEYRKSHGSLSMYFAIHAFLRRCSYGRPDSFPLLFSFSELVLRLSPYAPKYRSVQKTGIEMFSGPSSGR